MLSEDEKLSEWSEKESVPLETRMAQLSSFTENIYLDVKLVGFRENNSTLTAKELNDYFDSLITEDFVYVINADNHKLAVKKKYFISVTHASGELSQKILQTVNDELFQHKRHEIPVTVFDDEFKKDFANSGAAYTFYLVYPRKPSMTRYRLVVPKNSTEWLVQGEPKCNTKMWVGKERYFWYDISAFCPDYGPYTAGEGVVTSQTIPNIEYYFTINSTIKSEQMMLDVGNFMHKTLQQVISPSLEHFSLSHWKKLTIHLVKFHDHPVGQRDDPFNFDAILEELKQIPLLPGQQIISKKTEYHLATCLPCSFVVKNSIKAHTSAVYTKQLGLVVQPYLDSKELKKWFNAFGESLAGTPEEGELILPIYLFDFNYQEVLMLDRVHQAISFPDMVIAVQTSLPSMNYDLRCNFQQVSTDPRDATRAVLAAVLQSAFAISPTHLVWSPARNSTLEDFTWSVSNTPFGVLSTSRSLTFSQKDNAVKHQLYWHINQTISEVTSLLGHFVGFKKDLSEVISPNNHLVFVQRWNLLLAKLDEARKQLSLHNFNTSFYFVQSAALDVRAVHQLIHDAGRNLQTSFTCLHGEDAATTPDGGRGLWTVITWSAGLLSRVVKLSPLFFTCLLAFNLYFVFAPSFTKKPKIH